ncbi:MAG: hypothetical protein KJ607_11000 [Bacteroidetes bacterium]|nr:hypothetical protein [Bacteroidota bacterium]
MISCSSLRIHCIRIPGCPVVEELSQIITDEEVVMPVGSVGFDVELSIRNVPSVRSSEPDKPAPVALIRKSEKIILSIASSPPELGIVMLIVRDV